MTTITVYKVVDTATGLYMTAGGGWAKTGKTWESIGRLKNALVTSGFYSTYNGEYQLDPPPETWEIVEIEIRQDEANRSPVANLVLRERRFKDLSVKYGRSFSDLVRRIEDQGQQDQFQWVMVCGVGYDWQTKQTTGDLAEMLALMKPMKLKQNRDYKKATSGGGGMAAVAFASKRVAMRIRLAMQGRVTGIDIKNYVEANLDGAESDALST